MIEYINTLDISVIQAVQSVGPSWYVTAWILSFIIGSTKWLAPAIVAVLLLIGKKRAAVEVLVIFVISAAFLFGAKHLIDASRPILGDGITIYAFETSAGMPSGHAFLSMVIFGWLWFRHPASRILSLGAGTLIFLIGLSRVYLGVHYPSQVITGWLLGLVFLWIFWWVDRVYFRPRSSYVEKARK